MKTRQRLVIDTNAWISYLLIRTSVPGRAVRAALDYHHVLLSRATMEELAEVLVRPKFDRYLTIAERQEFLLYIEGAAQLVPITSPIRACRGPRDDKFLELAVHGEADCLVTGDADLLSLHPFHSVAIVTPAAWLAANRP